MRLSILTVITCVIVGPTYAKYSGGGGTAQDPFQIATAVDLMTLGETPADYDKHFLLTADIDLDPSLPGGKVFDRAVIAPDVDGVADWFQGTPFTGVFDGKGHTISHATIIGKDDIGRTRCHPGSPAAWHWDCPAARRRGSSRRLSSARARFQYSRSEHVLVWPDRRGPHLQSGGTAVNRLGLRPALAGT